MNDVPIAEAMLLWNSGLNGGTPAAVVRPLGHDDYDVFTYSSGACWMRWRTSSVKEQKLQLMVDAWHVAVFYAVPIEAVHEALLVIPEYRDMLADDRLPVRFAHERERA